MEHRETSAGAEELRALCAAVRGLIARREYGACEELIRRAMGRYPNAAEPHNLLGILLEKEGDHPGAMRHFRAAWDLDPTYLPARKNLDRCGTFFPAGGCVYGESGREPREQPGGSAGYAVEYDAQGIGHVVRRN